MSQLRGGAAIAHHAEALASARQSVVRSHAKAVASAQAAVAQHPQDQKTSTGGGK